MNENTLHLSLKRTEQYQKLPKIVVMGVGGGGCNAVNNMMEKKIDGVEFIAVNTDIQSLVNSKAEKTIQLGKNITKGEGAGVYPEIGLSSAEESREEIEEALEGVKLLFLTTGMGGGTGTGATPFIAKLAKEKDILTVAVVTKPFQYEGVTRLELAEHGIAELRKYADTMIVLPNENLFKIANKETKLQDAFMFSDNVLYLGVKGITDLITTPGLINLDFADVRMVIKKMGRAMMGMGEAEGEDRAIKAVKEALSNPLLENVNIKGAAGALVNITGSPDMTLFEFDEAAKLIKEEIGSNEATIKVGMAFVKELEGKVRVSIFATGMQEDDGHIGTKFNERQRLKAKEPEMSLNNLASLENNDSTQDKNEAKEEETVEESHKSEDNTEKKSKANMGKTKITTKKGDDFFDMGVPYVEEVFEKEEKSDSLFFGLFGKSKHKSTAEENTAKSNTFKSKNRQIEFKTNSHNDGLDEKTLDIPAYLRKKK